MHGLALIVVALVCYQTSASIEDEAKRHYKVATGVDWTRDTKFTIASNDDFEEFVRKYQKQYSSSIERLYRQRIFQINSWLAQAYESTDQGTAKYGITPFSDMSAAEFKQYYANLKADMMEPPTENAVIPNIVAPKSVDWRTKGAVTPVKNQQQCGSCWSFSTTGNIEGQWFIHKGTLLSLSEQQLVDCDKTSYGCNGGWPTHAYPYIKQAGGIESEQDYPYTARDGNCRFDPARVVARVQSYVNISHKEDDMATWCAANGPVSILLNANEMQLYRGGIAHPTTTTCNPKNLDHAVLIVGYGVDTQQQTPVPFWIVKNSWGPQWGEEGYWRVYRGGGVCGLNSAPSSAVV